MMVLTIIRDVAIGLMIPLAIWGVRKFIQHNTEHMLLKHSQMAQLRHNIITACECAIERGFVTRLQLESIHDQHKWYSQMGGNGLVTDLLDRVSTLDLKGEHYHDS